MESISKVRSEKNMFVDNLSYGLHAPKYLNYLALQSIDLMNVIPETCCVNKIKYLCIHH